MLQTRKTFSTLHPLDRLAMVHANQAELDENNRAHWLGARHRKAKCLCVTRPATKLHAFLASVKKGLRSQGLPTGQVSFVNFDDCLQRGKLSESLLLNRLAQEYRLAESQGFQTCDISCDMHSLHPFVRRLPRFLANLNNGFQDSRPGVVLVQFPRKGLPADVFQTLLDFGALVVLNGRIRRNICLPSGTSAWAKSGGNPLKMLRGIDQYNRVLDQNTALFSLFEQHGPAFCIIDDQGGMTHWNRAFAGLTGLSPDPGTVPVPLSSVIRLGGAFPARTTLLDQQPPTVQGELKLLSGKPVFVTLTMHLVPGTQEPNLGIKLVTVHETCSEPCGKSMLCQAEKQYQRIFELSRRGLARISLDGTILHANKTFAEMLGYQFQEALHGQGMHWWEANCVIAEQRLSLFDEIQKKGSVSKFELEVLTANKQSRQLLLDAFAADDRKDGELSFIAVVEDVTEQKKSERQLLHQAFHDQLTGLPNKALLMDRMAMALQRTKRREKNLFALAFLDIDDFKRVNDTLGHVLGDQVLVKVARKIMRSVRNVDTVSRFGGDEFVILLDGIEDEHEAVRILGRVREELALPMPLARGQELVCTVSAGLVLSRGYASATDMLRDADTAMYKAKTGNKGNIHLFKLPRGKTSRTTDISSRDLSRAMDHGEFRLHYQPIFRVAGNRIAGFEALIRWQHPGHGLLHPAEFLSRAEKSGHIIPLAHWVLGTACAQMRTWQLTSPCDQPLTICVNLSAEQFMYPGIVQSVQSVLEATDLDERSLKLEFSRTAMSRSGNIGELLMRLKELDVQLSIDDFGMGYSTLLHLQRYPFVPIDTLKIDRSVISRLTDHADYQEMVWTTIMLAHGLGVEVVAEGVETREQLALLAEMNCDHAQGYLFSKPLQSAPAEEFLKSHVRKMSPRGARTENLSRQPLART